MSYNLRDTWLVATVLLTSCIGWRAPEWGLPVVLDQSTAEVRNILGVPDAVINPGDNWKDVPKHLHRYVSPTMNVEWYYSSGIVGTFVDGRLTEVFVPPPHTDYQGFIPYAGTIVNGVKLTDTKQTILRKLGEPTKVEEEPLELGTDPDVPVVWPAESRYYWRKVKYTVRIDFLRQAQSLNETQKLTSPRDAVRSIDIYQQYAMAN